MTVLTAAIRSPETTDEKTAGTGACGEITQSSVFVNQTQFTKQASDSLDNTVFADSSDGFFDGTKTPHAPSTGKKHML